MPRVTINPAREIVAIIAIIAVMVVSEVIILVIQQIVLKGYEYGYRIHIEQYGADVTIGDWVGAVLDADAGIAARSADRVRPHISRNRGWSEARSGNTER